MSKVPNIQQSFLLQNNFPKSTQILSIVNNKGIYFLYRYHCISFESLNPKNPSL